MIFSERIKKYLSKQNLSAWNIETKNKRHYNNIIIVPALAELNNIKVLLDSLSKNNFEILKNTLILFVINNTPNHNNDVKTENRNTLKFLRSEITNNKLNIAVIDAATEGKELPAKNGGVGFARKIGADLSLSLFDYSSPNKKTIIQLDADCTVSENYLETICNKFNNRNISAGYVNFRHRFPQNPDEQRAIINYEIFLRYYVLGLMYANSPYAFFTIGSTIVCDYETYIKAGGMNKKKAAEDFYFMQKISKFTNIHKIDGAFVFPSARASWRTPFGTGQRVKRFLSGKQNEYLLYSPEIFFVLKNWLSLFYNKHLSDAKEYLIASSSISLSLNKFLTDNNFEAGWNNIIANSKSEEQLTKQKSVWMDGFKTLKLVHYLRDNQFPNVNMFAAIDSLLNKMKIPSKLSSRSGIPSLKIQLEYLKLLQSLTD